MALGYRFLLVRMLSSIGYSIFQCDNRFQFPLDEGILKIYLRGRPLNFYAPTDIAADYDFSAELPPPEEQLKLEWVYPFTF